MTFIQSLNAFADRVLATTLGTVEAGACVPENGHLCGCMFSPNGYCWKSHNPQWLTQTQYSCYGRNCYINPNACCQP